MNLEEIRSKLDKIDRELLEILSKRIELIPHVAEYKKTNNIVRYQPDREKEIFESKRKLAKELNINPDLVEEIYKLIISESHRIEKDIMGK